MQGLNDNQMEMGMNTNNNISKRNDESKGYRGYKNTNINNN